MTDEKKPFPLEKILPINAQVYVASQSKSLDDFEYVGVHAMVDTKGSLISKLAEEIPNRAEIVTDLIYSGAGAGSSSSKHVQMYASAVALIPKKG